jgi:hypothetical protein
MMQPAAVHGTHHKAPAGSFVHRFSRKEYEEDRKAQSNKMHEFFDRQRIQPATGEPDTVNKCNVDDEVRRPAATFKPLISKSPRRWPRLVGTQLPRKARGVCNVSDGRYHLPQCCEQVCRWSVSRRCRRHEQIWSA